MPAAINQVEPAPGLIERLNAATSPSRYLDRSIHVYLVENGLDADGPYKGSHPRLDDVPHFTSSLDAARTLVAGFYWVASEGRTRDSEPLGGAQVFRRDYLVKPLADAEHERIEIALCIAALKARMISHAS